MASMRSDVPNWAGGGVCGISGARDDGGDCAGGGWNERTGSVAGGSGGEKRLNGGGVLRSGWLNAVGGTAWSGTSGA